MARPPKMVGSTSGQGVSRRAYQVSRSLGAKGAGAPGASPLKNVPSGSTATGVSSARHYPKDGPTSGMNIAYSSREMANPDLGSLMQTPTTAVPPLRGGGKRPRGGKSFL